MEVVEFFKRLEWFILVGVKIFKGVLFVGFFGIGKIFLVKVIVGEVGVLFFVVFGEGC